LTTWEKTVKTTTKTAGERDRLMRVSEVLAELGGVSRYTFYRWRRLRVAPPCMKLRNGDLLIRRGDFLDWLETLRSDAA
jgi:predicted DNA-binding transcriptional regulator AlpA